MNLKSRSNQEPTRQVVSVPLLDTHTVKSLQTPAVIVTSEMALLHFRLMPPGGHIWIPIGPKFGTDIVGA